MSSFRDYMLRAGLATPRSFQLFADATPASGGIAFEGSIVPEEERVAMHEWLGAPAVSAAWLRGQMEAYEGERVLLRINSPGGRWHAMSAVRQAMEDEKRPVDTFVEGIAASAASVVALSGERRGMAPMAHLIVHRPWSAVVGDSDNMLAEAQVLEGMEQMAEEFYSSVGIEDAAQAMRGVDGQGSHITASEAFDMGIIHKVGGASFDNEDASAYRKSAFQMAVAATQLRAAAGGQDV